ncbi:hypothetical protein J9253_07530 [Thiothrix litoralis]|jgi:hypothetical protein|uniref:Phage protein n=1 Tax=Thiothrix litoralis TaxID=2891210 RepID=A0ABX7X3Q5_9GAMM|nr:hypothetical protein [Thiothrix litoralis]QTR47760.1 hypothetical protein J9253_07530 [Thiothrix litoralis]
MNAQVENILKQIKASASSLEIFADTAIGARFGERYTRESVEIMLVVLEHLQEQHDQLKQAMEGGK